MEKKFIVEVTAVCDPEDLDASDLDADEQSAIEGSYRITLDGDLANDHKPSDRVFDVFHSVVQIACLEDYMIIVRKEVQSDAGQDWLRADLGIHSHIPAAITSPVLEP